MHTQEDIRLAQEVRQALASSVSKADTVIVDVEHQIATLKGVVANETERRNVLAVARSVPGVRNIIDHLRLAGHDSQTVGEYVDDALITTAVKGKLLAETGINSFSISVETDQGVVTLTGEVDKHEHASLAERTAKMTNGVRRVDNRLVYKP